MQMMPTKEETSKSAETDFTLCPRLEQTFTFLGKKWNGLIIDVLLEMVRNGSGTWPTRSPGAVIGYWSNA